jgi:hypothetical protein
MRLLPGATFGGDRQDSTEPVRCYKLTDTVLPDTFARSFAGSQAESPAGAVARKMPVKMSTKMSTNRIGAEC